MLTRTIILNVAKRSNDMQKNVHQTFSALNNRIANRTAYEAWEAACIEWNNTQFAPDYLWLNETLINIKNGVREAVEDAILFLEVDPWYFRSGYLKERLTCALKKAPLSDEDKERIRRVIINIANGANRREFRYYCKLAAKVVNDEFIDEIKQLAMHAQQDNKGKFAYLLRYLREHRVPYRMDISDW